MLGNVLTALVKKPEEITNDDQNTLDELLAELTDSDVTQLLADFAVGNEPVVLIALSRARKILPAIARQRDGKTVNRLDRTSVLLFTARLAELEQFVILLYAIRGIGGISDGPFTDLLRAA